MEANRYGNIEQTQTQHQCKKRWPTQNTSIKIIQIALEQVGPRPRKTPMHLNKGQTKKSQGLVALEDRKHGE